MLVALYDDRPVPKIIDFGVAKATHQQLTEKTLVTGMDQIVGTLEYMSPEQAVLNQLDVDTRTDVYSLGVLLYELLNGVTPLESRRLRSAALDETLRIILLDRGGVRHRWRSDHAQRHGIGEYPYHLGNRGGRLCPLQCRHHDGGTRRAGAGQADRRRQ